MLKTLPVIGASYCVVSRNFLFANLEYILTVSLSQTHYEKASLGIILELSEGTLESPLKSVKLDSTVP